MIKNVIPVIVFIICFVGNIYSQNSEDIDTVQLETASYAYNKYSLLGSAYTDDKANKEINVAFDRFGDLYPETSVDNDLLRNHDAALKFYYKRNKDFKKQLNGLYSYKGKDFDILEDIMSQKKGEIINAKLKETGTRSITFIMCGYKNTYDDQKSKLAVLKDTIESYLKNNKKTLVIKVYWDGTHSYMPLTYANVNSYYAGLGLRQLIKFIDCDEIVIISHSLGANVVCETLFNQISKVTKRDGVEKELKKCYRDSTRFPTPKQKVYAGIVACAIPGSSTFEDYFKRSPKFNKAFTTDNYHIIVGFNQYDYAINKVIGILLSAHLSSTTLGCREDEYRAVVSQFEDYKIPDHIDRVDFSYFDSLQTQKHRDHNLDVYMGMYQYRELLNKLYNH